MVRSAARLAAILLGSAAFSAWALGFGDLAVTSGLGEPLRARIPLLDVSAANVSRLHVGFPSKSAFASAGVERPSYLSQIHLKVVTRGGKAYIRLTTKQPLRTPYLDLLIQIRTPDERLLREFTALINPAGSAAPQPVLTSSSTAASRPSSNARAQPQPSSSESRQLSRYGPVARNETLWGIADKLHRRRGVSIDQMLIGLYRKNPGAFLGSMSALKVGSELKVPSRRYLASVTPHQAISMVERSRHAGAKASRRGTLKLVAAKTAPKTSSKSRAGTVASSGAASGKAAAPGASSGLIHISNQALAMLEEKALQSQGNSFKAEPLPAVAAASTAAQGGADRAQGQQKRGAHPAVASALAPIAAMPVKVASATQAPNARSVKAASAAQAPGAQPLNAGHSGGHSAGTLAQASRQAGGGAAAQDARKTATAQAADRPAGSSKPKNVPAASSAWWHTLVFNRKAQALLLLLLVLVLMISRRRRANRVGGAQNDSALGDVGDSEEVVGAKAVALSGDGLAAAMQAREDAGGLVIDNGVRGRAGEPVVAEARDPEDAQVLPTTVEDALADADFNMTYGLYEEALTGLRQPSLGYPGEHVLRLKELEVLFSAGRADEFLALAQSLRGELSDDDRDGWKRVVRMGKALLPHEPLFLRPGDQSVASADTQPSQASAGAPAEGQAHLDAGVAPPDEAAREAIKPQGEAQSSAAAADADDSGEPAMPPDDDRDRVVEFNIDDLFPPSPAADVTSEDFLDMPGIDFETPGAEGAATSERAGPSTVQAPDGGADDWEHFLSSEQGTDQQLDANQWGVDGHATSSPGAVVATQGNGEATEANPFHDGTEEPVSDDDDGDDVEIKLSLARAYVDMGEREMAEELIGEVISQGSESQRHEAEALREKLG